MVQSPDSWDTMTVADGPNFLLSGYYGKNLAYDQGRYGYCWSSTARSSVLAYSLYLNCSGVTSADFNIKYYGCSVRCVYDE